MCFKVYDLDNDTPQVSDDDFLGQIECTLGEVGNHLIHIYRLLGIAVVSFVYSFIHLFKLQE